MKEVSGQEARLGSRVLTPSSPGSSRLTLRLWSHLVAPPALLRDTFLINFCDRTKSGHIIDT